MGDQVTHPPSVFGVAAAMPPYYLLPVSAVVLPMPSIEAVVAEIRLVSGLFSERRARARAGLLLHAAIKSQQHDAQLLLHLGQTTQC